MQEFAPLPLPTGGVQIFFPNFFKPGSEPSDAEIATSYLGTPVYSNLIFNADADTPENTDLVLDTVIMSVNQEKNIVRTTIAGRDYGTVKEYIGRGDYQILIQGLIVSPYQNVFPKDEITALQNLLSLPKSLAVASSFLQIFSIHDIVVEGYTIDEVMGSRNQMQFSIRAISDQPIELKDL